jgi:hydrogenase expression/formation protein HypC
MCLGIPGKVVEITEGMAKVDVGGTRKEASLMLLEEASIGDYVIVHAGFAIEKVDEKEAEKTLEIVDELIAEMEKQDHGKGQDPGESK